MSGSPTWEPYVDDLLGILDGARETCITAGLIQRTSFTDAITALRAWKDRPDAAMWFAISLTEGVREK
jgi:hypothetical protein